MTWATDHKKMDSLQNELFCDSLNCQHDWDIDHKERVYPQYEFFYASSNYCKQTLFDIFIQYLIDFMTFA